MSEDEEANLLASEAPHRQGDLVLYDYCKHLTTLSLQADRWTLKRVRGDLTHVL